MTKRELTLRDAILKADDLGIGWAGELFYDPYVADAGVACMLGAAAVACDPGVFADAVDNGVEEVEDIVFDVLAGDDSGLRVLLMRIPAFNDGKLQDHVTASYIEATDDHRPDLTSHTWGERLDWKARMNDWVAEGNVTFHDVIEFADLVGGKDIKEALDHVVCEIEED